MPVGDRVGGAEQMLWLFLKYVDRSQVRPSIVFLRDGPFRHECAEMAVPVKVIPSDRIRDVGSGIRTIGRLARHFRAIRPQLIVEWFGKSHIWVTPAAMTAGLGSRIIWWQRSVTRTDALARLTTLLPARAIGAESAAAADA